MVRELLEELVADRAVDHLLHMRVVAEHEGQVEDVELGNQRTHRADADARDGERADLRLLDHLLLAAELHRRIDFDAEAAVGLLLELLAHPFDRLDGRVAERMHVGRLEDHLGLGQGRAAEPQPARRKRRKRGKA
jgi:hypothetical protein